ncbi:MAG TPA: aspartate aminotransferase family protein [Egibacteraceae bacterium]|nr:aspartate aminotransferase family protein [Egibacteraceae bacterium]
MTGLRFEDRLADLDEERLPAVHTDIPGPRSAALWERDARFHASNASFPAQSLRLVINDGSGALVRDVDGNVFIDFSSGIVVTNLGHAPPAVVEALTAEAGRLLHFFDFATPPRVAFFEALSRTLPPSLQTYQMYTTGAEAVEAAMRLAKAYTGNYEFISFFDAWHGRTLGAMSLMGGFPLKHGYGPFAPGVLHSANAYCYRCPLGLERDRCEDACAAFVDRVYAQSSERRLAAVIIEPVQGVGGAIVHSPAFLSHLREFCDRTGALLIFDEILTGVGRTGSMWAFEQTGVVPDILIAGKGLASGYPVSLIASRREILDVLPFGQPGAGASTFASGNLACAAGAATLDLLADGTVLAGARRVGGELFAGLRELAERHPMIGEVRGQGLLLALELVRDRQTKERVPPEVGRELLAALARRGVLVAGGGAVVRITPPLVVSQTLARRGLALLDEALTEVEQGLAMGAPGG